MKALILRFEGPMMSFGDVAIDESRGTDRHPLKSMVVGVLANAMGFERTRPSDIQSLQDSILIASRLDRPGGEMVDYQTALAGDGSETGEKRSFIQRRMWSSRGYVMGRSNTDRTYQMWKGYRTDASVTVAVWSDDLALVERLGEAVRNPARPIFLGRKGCLPSRPLFETFVEAEDVAEAVFSAPAEIGGAMNARWPAELGDKGLTAYRRTVCDLRDWANGVPSGQRDVFEAMVEVEKRQ